MGFRILSTPSLRQTGGARSRSQALSSPSSTFDEYAKLAGRPLYAYHGATLDVLISEISYSESTKDRVMEVIIEDPMSLTP